MAIETSYDICGTALFNGTDCIAIEEKVAPRQHNALLAPMARRLLHRTGISLSEITGLAISGGPGSYTGLRIGMSYTKGLAFAADLPVYLVPSLPALTMGTDYSTPFWVVTPSRENEIFALKVDAPGVYGDVLCLRWEEFEQRQNGSMLVGYRIGKFTSETPLHYREVSPSAEKVGLYALRHSLDPIRNLEPLTPEYHSLFQITSK